MNKEQDEVREILELAADAATDIIVAKMDVQKTDRDYADRRRYARERLAEFLADESDYVSQEI